MASGTFYTSANGDDGHRTPSYYSITNNYLWWGTSGYLGSFILFNSVSIPQGETINEAKLRLRCAFTQGAGTGSADIHCADADNQGQVIDAATYDALPTTTAKTNVPSQTIFAGTVYEFDITSAVQEVVNRPSFGESTIGVKIIDIDTSVANRWYAHNYSGGTYKPELYVDWGEAEQVDIQDDVVLGDIIDAQSPKGEIQEDVVLGDTIDGSAPKGEIQENVALGDVISAVALVGNNVEDAALGDVVETQVTYETPSVQEDAALGDDIDAFNLSQYLTENILLGDTIDRERQVEKELFESIDLGASFDAFNFSEWIAQNRDLISYRYECTLTGTPDGEEDLTLPVKTIQARLNTGSQSYVSVVIPTIEYAEGIADRPNGEIVIDMIALLAGSEVLREEIIRVNLDAVRSDEGASSQSITIEGHATHSFPVRYSSLDYVTYRRFQDGKYVYRCAIPDWYLKPGHVATYGETSFTVDSIIFFVTVTNQYFQSSMEVYE